MSRSPTSVPGIHWPSGHRMALAVTLDFFDTAAILTQEPRMLGREKSLSVWQYGAHRGVDRLLRLFEELQIHASWFVPGVVAQSHSALVQEIHQAGHELGSATWACEDFDHLPLVAQVQSLQAGQEALQAVTGTCPKGFRAPFGNWAPGFSQALRAAGIQWSSSWRGDDRPYLHPAEADDAKPLVELPLHYELEDEPYFAFNLYPPVPVGQSRIASYREVLNNWCMDLRGFRRLGLCLPLRLHPEWIGTAGRIDLLRAFLSEVRQHGDIWVSTGGQIAQWWAQQHPCNPPGHPVDIFHPLHQAPAVPSP